ncbi:MAG: histidinol-phosphate transaminase [Candidatus Hydrogenedentes bacterium]|nr:histidinol-phosphate transaminase [Candidatus Hydrogenedentota bacterium]
MRFVREILKDVEGYTPGEQPQGSNLIKLNTNENPYPPAPGVLEALRNLSADALRKYPDPLSVAFRRACAQRYGAPDESWIFAGNGMDELLAMVLRTFVDPGDTVVATYPTYSLYEILCVLHGAKLHYVDLDDDFQLTPDFMSASGRLCFLTRPNAPTGVAAPREAVADFCARFQGIVVIDEAYADFAADTCMDFPDRFDNVIVMRTFSKSFSLAGMRVGTMKAQPQLVREFLKTKDSYNMNAASQAAALAAITDYDHMLASVAKVCATRQRLREALVARGFRVPESQSNFLLAHWNGTPSAKDIFQALSAQQIFVRYFSARRLENALRITIGTDAECDALLAAIDGILGAAK